MEAPKLLWLCTAPATEQGRQAKAASSSQAFRKIAREYVSLNDEAASLPPLIRIAEEMDLDWSAHRANSVIALLAVKPHFTYDDLRALSFPERTQCSFYCDLAWSSTDAMFFSRSSILFG